MCGRFALTLPLTAVIEWFAATPRLGAAPALATLDRPRHNIRPTETLWTVAAGEAGREIRPMRWGFLPRCYKGPSDGPLLINARSETIAEKPAFREACRTTRCLIPADGFYEWKTAEGRGKAPHWIHPAAGDRVAFAGVWRQWTAPPGSPGGDATLDTVAIVTASAGPPIDALHHRTPVVIEAADFGLWLGEAGHGAAALMRAAEPAFWAFHPVSTAINRGGRDAPDEPALRAPVDMDAAAAAEPPPKDPPAQGDLF